MFSIAKRFSFDASHQLSSLPEGHKCARLHGHTYTVEVELACADLDDHGMVVDYGMLGVFKSWLDFYCDHHHLNDAEFLKGKPPTAEVLAHALFEVVSGPVVAGAEGRMIEMDPAVQVTAVRVSETPNTWAEWRPVRSQQ